MQRYFFDLSAGGWQCQDDIGLILCSQDEIRGEATRTAIAFAGAGLPGADLSDLKVRVRDRAGEPVMTVSLALTVRGPEEPVRLGLAPRPARPRMVRAA
ncbi:DUF6894 family protein [Methylobacterium platani]|uniref:DUF6894 domain-containing protein n=2 Tax=Methylobacterium platani TaxID=427683 RepID=A0ABR5H5A3_9HYPH|nr:hypothetical protein [Methylobacterium platani]KMO19182.1 hypothetical protein SQ03_08565 [Methylobacterium platani JCM 14648]